jgi:predicted MPP superfamily phosphohydrolase
VFVVVLILVVTLMQAYIFWRTASVPWVHRLVSRKVLFRIGMIFWLILVLNRVLRPYDMGGAAAVLEYVGMGWLGILFLMFAALLSVEMVTGFGFWLKRFVPHLRGIALIVGSVLSCIALGQGMRAPVVVAHEVTLANLPKALDGTVIVALSDMHVGAVLDGQWIAARVAQVQAERPDAVVLIGDIFEGYDPPSPVMLAELRRLSAPLGVWAVLGNHEFYGAPPDHPRLFEAAGAKLLRNQSVALREGLVLAGIDNVNNQPDSDAFTAKALKSRPAGATILLSHEPFLPAPAARKGVDLMLSGHTHGGQIWPFNFLVKQRFPLLVGHYTLDDMQVIVSRGAGTWGPRMRLWQRSEITRITLRSGVQAR